MMNVRVAAAEVLAALDRGRTTLAAQLERARRPLEDERDRALLFELSAGTLRWRQRLDALLIPCSNRALTSLDPRVRAVLRIAAYQFEYLPKIPARAVVHQAVAASRTLGCAHASGFVNAVLRAWLRKRATLRLPRRPKPGATPEAQIAFLATTLSHPEWLVARWLDRYGFDNVERWCTVNNQIPETTVRARYGVTAGQVREAFEQSSVASTPAQFAPDAWRLGAGALGQAPEAVRDLVDVQDEASQIVAHAVGAQPGEQVLDVCAAPGGKTELMAMEMRGEGRLVAADFRATRLRLLHGLLSHDHVPAMILGLDATKPLPFPALFDRVLLDAPCSGLGTLARDPDVKWTRTEADLPALASQQALMLRRAADVVRPGGTLLYAACSLEPEETDNVVAAFLAENPQFSLTTPRLERCQEAGSLVDERGFLRTLPFRHGLDGFSAALLVRREST